MLVILWLGLIFGCISGVVLAGCCFMFSRRSAQGLEGWAGAYECGFLTGAVSFDSFGFSYFSLMVLFVIFDLEVSLLLNLPEQGVLFDSFYYYLLFLGVLVGGFLGELCWGYVHWGY
uniref:NADH-ubiquinone oxidoreductase chain 3 n=1 Tax=Wenyonia virilis TaxID=947536 RepID=H9YU54_9CEST|nr:NADH dehydrogenase subunit 3 [Wenyonia virilis]